MTEPFQPPDQPQQPTETPTQPYSYPPTPQPYINLTNVNAQANVGSHSNNSGFAVASLVLGILGLVLAPCLPFILSILAVIFGHVALHIDIPRNHKSGRGMAIAGLAMGYIIVAGLLVIVAFMGLAATIPAASIG